MRTALAIMILAFLACHPRPSVRVSPSVADPVRKPVTFEFDRWSLTAEAGRQLAQKAGILLRHERVGLTLEGHTDSIGDPEYNLWLGDRRARSVQVELVRQGIDPRRLIVLSHGEDRPKSLGERSEDHAVNRRVEFVIR